MATKKRATKKRATKKKAKRAAKIEIKVDRALARAWKKARAVIQKANIEGTRAWDRKYEAVGQILAHEPPLYLAGGVSSATDFFATYLPGEERRTVLRNVRVAQYASPEEEARYGTSKLDAAIEYLEAKHGKATKGRIPVDFEKLRIETGEGSVGFSEATVEAIRSAARLAARGAKGAKGAKPANRNPVVSALTRKLPKGAKDVTVHYAGGRVTLGRIPVALFGQVLRALAGARLPAASG